MLKRWPFLAVSLLITGFSTQFVFLPEAEAQIPLQDNPVFTTPPPEEQKLGPDPAKPFLKGVITGGIDATEQPQIEKLGEIRFEGNRFYRDSLIQSKLEPLTGRQGEAISREELESFLVRINKNNPFKLKATLQPGSLPGTTDVLLDVFERQPWQLTTSTDNQGRPGIGTQRGGVGLTNESLFGFGDRLGLQYLGAEGTNYVTGTYDYPINRSGGTLGLITEFTHVDGRFGTATEHNADHYALGIRYVQPFDKNRIWTGDIGFLGRHINVNNTHPDPRFAFAGIKFNKPDKYGSSLVYLQTFLGQDFWFGGDSKFWRVRGQGIRWFNLPKDNRLMIKATAQYSPDALIPVQMIQLAGAYVVRGYSEGLLYADSGIVTNIEHYWPVPFLNRIINPDVANRIRGVSFFDFAQGWLRSSRGVSPLNTHIMSAGVGLRYRLTQYTQGFVDVAWGIGTQDNFAWQNKGVGPEIEPSTRIHFGVRSDLLSRNFKKQAI